MAINFDKDIQRLLIEMMLTEPSLFVRAAPILEPDYFHLEFQDTVKFLHQYSKEYSTLPTLDQLKAECKIDFKKLPEFNTNHQIAALDSIEAFCKHRAVELAVLDCARRIKEGSADGIEKIVKDAVLTSLQRDLGTDYFEDPRARMEKINSEQGELSTGWDSVDKVLYGGWGWGELEIFVAPTGGGKSVALQNSSRLMIDRALAQGLNVIYITLELKEELVAKRIDGQFTDIPLNLLNRKIDEVEAAIVLKGKTAGVGRLQLKYLRPQSTTTDLEAYIQEYEIRTGIIPNIIVVDYLDLLRPADKSISAGDFFMKDKLVSEELRAMAADRTKMGKKTSVLTASQVNRDGMDEMEFSVSGIAGGISKAYGCDNLVAVYASLPMRERGEMQFQFLKTRNSGGNGRKLLMKYDPDTLKISDHEDFEEATQSTTNKITDKINRAKKGITDRTAVDKPVFDNTKTGEDLAQRGAMLTGMLAEIKTKT